MINNASFDARIEYMDLFRGIGILFMMMGHVECSDWFDKWIHAFHMPMFFFVSGYFYTSKLHINIWKLIWKKISTLIVPYFIFAFFHLFIDSIQERVFDMKKMINIFFMNMEGIPIAGALWFLTAMFWADIIYVIIDRKTGYGKIMHIIVFLIATFGTISGLVLPFDLPWALNSSCVAIGFIHIARILKKCISTEQNRLKNSFSMPIYISLLILIIASVLIYFNGYINMRISDYSIIPLFWVNSILIILSLVNLCKMIDDIPGLRNLIFMKCIKYIGKNSIVFLCLNQLTLNVMYKLLCVIKVPTILLTPFRLLGGYGTIVNVIYFNKYRTQSDNWEKE